MRRLSLLLALTLPGVLAADEPCTSLEQAAFMLGAWQSETQGTRFMERWRRDEGQFRGTAEALRDGERIQLEVMTLRVGDGKLVYGADPEQDGSFEDFTGVRCAAGEAVFENPEHDFPQRLHYHLDDSGVLTAVVSDLEDQGFELEFQPDS